jgi:hypothetical protein
MNGRLEAFGKRLEALGGEKYPDIRNSELRNFLTS